jgi:hypothetical protein
VEKLESKSKYLMSEELGEEIKKATEKKVKYKREFVERSGKGDSRDRIAFFWEGFGDYRCCHWNHCWV